MSPPLPLPVALSNAVSNAFKIQISFYQKVKKKAVRFFPEPKAQKTLAVLLNADNLALDRNRTSIRQQQQQWQQCLQGNFKLEYTHNMHCIWVMTERHTTTTWAAVKPTEVEKERKGRRKAAKHRDWGKDRKK